MNSFDFYSPTYFVFGRDRENETGAYVKKFGAPAYLLSSAASLQKDPAFWGALRNPSPQPDFTAWNWAA